MGVIYQNGNSIFHDTWQRAFTSSPAAVHIEIDSWKVESIVSVCDSKERESKSEKSSDLLVGDDEDP